jgi:hypothetical protein
MCTFAAILIFFVPLPVALAFSLVAAALAAGYAAYLAHQVRAAAF